MPSPRSRKRPEPAGPAAGRPARFTRDYRIPAQPSVLVDVRRDVERAAACFGFEDRDRTDFVFAANEAVTNAIRHGNPDASGTIRLRIAADGERLSLAVFDCGPFVPRVQRRGPLEAGGRGFELMETLVDEVEVRAEPGRTMVRLSKAREPAR